MRVRRDGMRDHILDSRPSHCDHPYKPSVNTGAALAPVRG